MNLRSLIFLFSFSLAISLTNRPTTRSTTQSAKKKPKTYFLPYPLSFLLSPARIAARLASPARHPKQIREAQPPVFPSRHGEASLSTMPTGQAGTPPSLCRFLSLQATNTIGSGVKPTSQTCQNFCSIQSLGKPIDEISILGYRSNNRAKCEAKRVFGLTERII